METQLPWETPPKTEIEKQREEGGKSQRESEVGRNAQAQREKSLASLLFLTLNFPLVPHFS